MICKKICGMKPSKFSVSVPVIGIMAQVSTKDFRETTVPGMGHMAQLQFTQRTTDHELLMQVNEQNNVWSIN